MKKFPKNLAKYKLDIFFYFFSNKKCNKRSFTWIESAKQLTVFCTQYLIRSWFQILWIKNFIKWKPNHTRFHLISGYMSTPVVTTFHKPLPWQSQNTERGPLSLVHQSQNNPGETNFQIYLKVFYKTTNLMIIPTEQMTVGPIMTEIGAIMVNGAGVLTHL